MVLVSEVGGKFWADDLAAANYFNAANLNKMRIPGLIYQKPGELLTVALTPKRWLNGTTWQTVTEQFLNLNPSKTTYVYLDGSFAPATQMKASEVAFPDPSTGSFHYLAEIVTNSTTIVSITNVAIDRGGVAGAIQSIGVTAPITSTGGSTPTIGIVAATTSVPGSMSAADKTKLDGIAATAPAAADVVLKSAYAAAGRLLQGDGSVPVALALGTALQLLRVNAGATALEYFTASQVFDPQILVAEMTGFHNDAGLGFDVVDFATEIFQGNINVSMGDASRLLVNVKGKYGVFYKIQAEGAGDLINTELRDDLGSFLQIATIRSNFGVGTFVRGDIGLGMFSYDGASPAAPLNLVMRATSLPATFPALGAANNRIVIVKLSDTP